MYDNGITENCLNVYACSEGDNRLNVMTFCAILFYLLSVSLADCIVFENS